jgi:hypothetical protein
MKWDWAGMGQQRAGIYYNHHLHHHRMPNNHGVSGAVVTVPDRLRFFLQACGQFIGIRMSLKEVFRSHMPNLVIS